MNTSPPFLKLTILVIFVSIFALQSLAQRKDDFTDLLESNEYFHRKTQKRFIDIPTSRNTTLESKDLLDIESKQFDQSDTVSPFSFNGPLINVHKLIKNGTNEQLPNSKSGKTTFQTYSTTIGNKESNTVDNEERENDFQQSKMDENVSNKFLFRKSNPLPIHRENELVKVVNKQSKILPGASRHFSEDIQYYLPFANHSERKFSISKLCYADVMNIVRILQQGEIEKNAWILKLVDSWGWFEGGFLQGNFRAMGFFEECLSVHINHSINNTGRYCLITYVAQNIPLSYGTCIPSTCNATDLQESLNILFNNVGLDLSSIECQSMVDEVKYDSSNIFGIIVFSAFGLLLLVASLTDIFLRKTNQVQKAKEGYVKYLLAFSVPENMSKIFQIRYSKNPDVISCIHGIRFFSMTWVIFGHQYAFALTYSTNIPLEKTENFLFQLIINGDKSVDTFFLISGLVLGYQIFKEMNSKTDSFPWVNFYLHRFLRLAPPIALTVLFYASIAGLLAKGPMAPFYRDTYVDSCKTYWWMDWTFLTNFMFKFGGGLEEKTGETPMCLGQCWYTAVDTQIYIFMPLVILPLLKWEKKGTLLLIFWILLSFVVRGMIIAFSEPLLTPIIFGVGWEDSFNKLYTMPYARASPYLIGFGMGYLLAKLRGRNLKLNKYHVWAGWSLSTAVALYVMFALYPYNHFSSTLEAPKEIPYGYDVFYHTFQRGLWGACIAWVIFACHTGHGGVVNKFLSYAPLQPLSRLTYCFYLVSLNLQTLLFYSKMRTTYITHLSQVMDTCGILFISGIGALLLSLTIESPVITLMKLTMSKTRKNVAESKPDEREMNQS